MPFQSTDRVSQQPFRGISSRASTTTVMYASRSLRDLSAASAVALARYRTSACSRGSAIDRIVQARGGTASQRLYDRSSSFAACSSVGSMIGHDCSIAFGFPGRFTISVRPRTPDTPRVRSPRGVCSRASLRIASA